MESPLATRYGSHWPHIVVSSTTYGRYGVCRNRLLMAKDVEQSPKRISDEESLDAPGLHRRPICDGKARATDAEQDLVEIIDFDRQVRNRRPGTALRCDAYLRIRI